MKFVDLHKAGSAKNAFRILCVIPARFESSRFPGKPLAEIAGKSMIRRVYEQALSAELLTDIIVATDDERIASHVKSFNGEVIMTRKTHPSGTDRCEEVVRSLDKQYDYIINIQGDEPFIDPSQIDLLAGLLDGKTEIATLILPITSEELLFDTGEVKVVFDTNMNALYFSRSPIPFLKGVPTNIWHTRNKYFRHVGLYAYRSDTLTKITMLNTSGLEISESLEQLRWLENGYQIKLGITSFESHCIDCPEDIEKAIRLMKIR